MADGINVTEGAGKKVDSDEITRGGELRHQQVIKIALGADNAFDTLLDSGPQASSACLPVCSPTPDEGTPVSAELAFGSIGASYSALLTDAHDKKIIDILNATNQPVRISYNGSADHEYLPANTSVTRKVKDIDLKFSGNISVKYASAAPTAGLVQVTAIY